MIPGSPMKMSNSDTEKGKGKSSKRHVTDRGKKVVEQYMVIKDKKRRLEYERRLGEVYEFGLSLGIFRDVLKAKTPVSRIMWISLGIAACVFAILQMTVLFNNFLANPTQTKISYQVNTSILFPVVTICSYSRANATKIRAMNISHDLLAYMMSAFKGMYSFYNEYNIRQKQEALEEEYQSLLTRLLFTSASNFSLTNFFLEYGFDCNAFLVKCMFQGTDFPCCNGPPILSEVGSCFSVESQTFDSQTIPGPNGGLKITIDNSAHAYPTTMVNSNPDMGVQVHILHPDVTTKIGSSPLVIFPGTHAMVNLNAVYQTLLPNDGEWSCVPKGARPPKGFLEYFPSYSFESCFIECVAHMTLQTCGCIQIGSVPDITTLERNQLCDPSRATSCVQPLLQANNMGFLWDIYDIKDNCQCPLPCLQWQYERAVSYSSSPNPGYREARDILTRGEAGLNDSSLGEAALASSQDEIIIDLFFDSLVYRVIEETPIETYTSFLSSLGGQLALWLGFRLITALHLIYYGLFGLFKLFPTWIRSARKLSRRASRRVSTQVEHSIQRVKTLSRENSPKKRKAFKNLAVVRIGL